MKGLCIVLNDDFCFFVLFLVFEKFDIEVLIIEWGDLDLLGIVEFVCCMNVEDWRVFEVVVE